MGNFWVQICGSMNKINRIWLVVIVLVLLDSDCLLADNAIVNLNFYISNIAKPEEKTPHEDLIIKEIPYARIKSIHKAYRNQISIDRVIKLDWNIINYEPKKDLFANNINVKDDKGHNVKGYHLFDIIWFRPRLYITYKNDRGIWEKVYSLPSGYRYMAAPAATIKGYGNVPSYVTFGIHIPPNENPQNIDGFDETVEKEESKEGQFLVRVIRSPVIKSLYVGIDDEKLLDKKLEIFGSVVLGSSGISTQISPFYFPWDEYSFKFMYKAQYPSKIKVSMGEADDFDVASSKTIELEAPAGEVRRGEFTLLRASKVEKIFLPVAILLFSMVSFFIPSVSIRWLVYLLFLVFMYFTLPKPLNVPTYCLLTISVWFFYFFLIVIMELHRIPKGTFGGMSIFPKSLTRNLHSKKRKLDGVTKPRR